MIEIDNTSGRKWARFTLIVTLFVSVIANVTHSVLAASDITLWLRIPGAAIWPVLSFLAIEITVRIIWRRSWAHALARVFILGPAIPAVIVSYEHQERLLTLMGESLIVSRIGPLAIDGLMIGCTLALLFTREQLALAPTSAPEFAIAPEPARAPERTPTPPPLEQAEEVIDQVEVAARGSAAAFRAARALQDGGDTAAAIAASGLSAPAVRRYAAVVRELRQDPHAAIDARQRSVRPDVVDSIRAWARMESAR